MGLKEIPYIELFAGIGAVRYGLEQANRDAKQNLQCKRHITNNKGFRNGRRERAFNCVWANDWEDALKKWKPNKKGEWAWRGPKNLSWKIYTTHYGWNEYVDQDIRTIDPRSIPDHTLLTAGFPCQSFSVAGKRMGFQDTRGTLFHEICRIAKAKRPPLLLLENVRGLLSHDGGTTFQIILESLAELGYWCEWQLLNGKHFRVPQHRPRVFIVGHLTGSKRSGREIFPIAENDTVSAPRDEELPTLTATDYKGPSARRDTSLICYWRNSDDQWVIEDRETSLALKTQGDLARQPLALEQVGNVDRQGHNSIWGRVYNPEGLASNLNAEGGGVGAKTGLYIVADRTRTYAGKGRNLESPKEITNALSSVQKDNLLIYNHPRNLNRKGFHQVDETLSNLRTVSRLPSKAIESSTKLPSISPATRIRRLTPIECERLQAFPDGWTAGVSDTQRYRCLGNSIVTNVITYLGEKLLEAMG